jgi:signal peptidase I
MPTQAARVRVHDGAADLAVQVLHAKGSVRMGVLGSSMLPAIRPFDVLLLRRATRAPAIGEIVLFRRGSRFFVHRVVDRDGDSLVTQGDALGEPDPPIDRAGVLGRVVRVVRGRRVLRPARQAGRVAALFRRSDSAARWFLRVDSWRARSGL